MLGLIAGISMFLIPVFIVAFLLASSMLGALFNVVFIIPVAALLDSPTLKRTFKLIGLLMVSTGFYFTLLTT